MKSVHSKAPLRLGFAGGGTDVAPYSDIYGGQVLNATISLFTHCLIRPSEDNQLHFGASDFNTYETHPLAANISIDGQLKLHKAVYNRIITKYNEGKAIGVAVTTYSDAPPGSGIGASSSLVVAMVRAYAEFLNLALGDYDVAHLAYEIERHDCKLSGGKQDQYAAAFGGFNFMEFSSDDRVVVNPLRLRREVINELESRILLFYTGRSRDSAKIIDAQIMATKSNVGDAIEAMHEIRVSAVEMKEALVRSQVDRVLEILGKSWLSKKRTAPGTTNSDIDRIANTAIQSGASGLKISGAGGGGFMMIAVDPANRSSVIRALGSETGFFFSFVFIEKGVESWVTN